jgi:hypothetical protein
MFSSLQFYRSKRPLNFARYKSQLTNEPKPSDTSKKVYALLRYIWWHAGRIIVVYTCNEQFLMMMMMMIELVKQLHGKTIRVEYVARTHARACCVHRQYI